jgi:hypothetical protein
MKQSSTERKRVKEKKREGKMEGGGSMKAEEGKERRGEDREEGN